MIGRSDVLEKERYTRLRMIIEKWKRRKNHQNWGTENVNKNDTEQVNFVFFLQNSYH